MTLEESKKTLNEIAEECKLNSADSAIEYSDYKSAAFYDERYEAIDTVLKALEEITTENENLTLSQLDFTKSHISKDKIREKIKERENKRDNAEMDFVSALFERDINLLEELLGE